MASGALTLVQGNDVHGYLEPHPELVWDGAKARFPRLGGYARLAGYLNALRRERPVIVLDNGDTFHGTYPAVHSKGEALVPILNAVGFDAMTGHWDFAYGPAHLKSLAAQLDYPMLAVNCFNKDDGQLTNGTSRGSASSGLQPPSSTRQCRSSSAPGSGSRSGLTNSRATSRACVGRRASIWWSSFRISAFRRTSSWRAKSVASTSC